MDKTLWEEKRHTEWSGNVVPDLHPRVAANKEGKDNSLDRTKVYVKQALT